MPIVFYGDIGPYSGKGSPLTKSEGDGNIYELLTRILALEEETDGGPGIADITFDGGMFTVILTDGSEQGPFPLPVAQFTPRGEWLNSTTYFYLDLVTRRGIGVFLVLQEHTTPAAPAPFDSEATQGGDPLYSLMFSLRDVNYDVALFAPGPIVREPGTLLVQIMVPRAMVMEEGLAGAFAYLDIALESSTDSDTVILSIEKKSRASGAVEEIGTITFTPGEQDTNGGQDGVISFPAEVSFIAGDCVALRVTQSNNDVGGDMSVTLPAIRTDV